MGQSRPLFDLFSFFSLATISTQIEKKHRWCAWDSNPGPQDGRRRRNHGAMAATQKIKIKSLSGESSNSFGLIFARLLTKLRHKSGLAKCMLAKCVVSSNGVRVVVLNKCPMLGQHTVWWVTYNCSAEISVKPGSFVFY